MLHLFQYERIDIPSNFVSKENNISKCICNQTENLKHIYECNYLNREKPEVQFEQIFHGTIREQKKIALRIQYNMEQRTKLMNQPCDPNIGDPLSSVTIECIVMDK